MGKGDKTTKRGKIFLGSFGNCRPKKRKSRHFHPIITRPTQLDSNTTSYLVEEKKSDQIEWFKPKSYVHLGQKLTLNDHKWVESKVTDKNFVGNYCFYPLLHRVVSQRRFKKCQNGKKGHYDVDKHESTAKTRHIFYSNHLDSAIYSYYAKVVLGKRYEQLMTNKPELSACVSAYRTVPVNDKNKAGKSNIHFAKDVFDFIKNQPECVALAFDITGFFDNLNHVNLKRVWANLFASNDTRLDEDHFNIYQSLTKFTFIEEVSLHKLYGLHAITNRKKLNKKLEALGCYCKGHNGKEKNQFFRKKIARKLVVPHSKYECLVKGKGKGIPQGTPISAFLANLYLLEFDEKVLEKVKSIGGFYRRYSDDIMIICPQKHENTINKFVIELIASPNFLLEINPSKTEKSYFQKDKNGKGLISDKPIRYLGFEFNGNRTLLKCSALSKYHRRKKYFIKRKLRKTMQMKYFVDETQKLWRDEIRRKYSASGRRNFLSYVKRSSSIMGEKSIDNQLKNHKTKLFEAMQNIGKY